jgi:hypothetical protein
VLAARYLFSSPCAGVREWIPLSAQQTPALRIQSFAAFNFPALNCSAPERQTDAQHGLNAVISVGAPLSSAATNALVRCNKLHDS